MDHVRILGSRGSMSVGGAGRTRYGGATTCVLLCLGGQYAVLDAGTGLLELPPDAAAQPELPVLLTHLHLDHLLGLPLCPYLFSGGHMTVYSGLHEGICAQEALSRLYAPPLWPVSPAERLGFAALESGLRIGALQVDVLPGVHPNGVNILRLRTGGKAVVFATDCTLTPELLPRLAEFSGGCDLLLCDGQYTEEEFALRPHFGHSSWRMASELALRCGAKAFRVIHHDPDHDDAALDEIDREIRRLCPFGGAARQGEEILL